jgi:hypothetical protein
MNLPIRSLFLKIFLWFWVAMIIAMGLYAFAGDNSVDEMGMEFLKLAAKISYE